MEQLKKNKKFNDKEKHIEWSLTNYHLKLSILLDLNNYDSNYKLPPEKIGKSNDWKNIFLNKSYSKFLCSWNIKRVDFGKCKEVHDELKKFAKNIDEDDFSLTYRHSI